MAQLTSISNSGARNAPGHAHSDLGKGPAKARPLPQSGKAGTAQQNAKRTTNIIELSQRWRPWVGRCSWSGGSKHDLLRPSVCFFAPSHHHHHCSMKGIVARSDRVRASMHKDCAYNTWVYVWSPVLFSHWPQNKAIHAA